MPEYTLGKPIVDSLRATVKSWFRQHLDDCIGVGLCRNESAAIWLRLWHSFQSRDWNNLGENIDRSFK